MICSVSSLLPFACKAESHGFSMYAVRLFVAQLVNISTLTFIIFTIHEINILSSMMTQKEGSRNSSKLPLFATYIHASKPRHTFAGTLLGSYCFSCEVRLGYNSGPHLDHKVPHRVIICTKWSDTIRGPNCVIGGPILQSLLTKQSDTIRGQNCIARGPVVLSFLPSGMVQAGA